MSFNKPRTLDQINCYYCNNLSNNDDICELCLKFICGDHTLIESTDEDEHLFCLGGNCAYCGNRYSCKSIRKCNNCNKIACINCRDLIFTKDCEKCQ
jgi:hypothetical protein